jgi:uncharacterized protein (DUF1501 family)
MNDHQSAQAGNSRVTRGDAEAIFQAFGNGGWAIRDHRGTQVGAPADSQLRGSIRPFSGSPWDGRHFCAEDWHVLIVADIEDTRDQVAASVMQLTLDGATLATTRTAVKRFLKEGAQSEAYYAQEGAILSPSELSVGSHELAFAGTFFDGSSETDQITFYIDPAGTGACI